MAAELVPYYDGMQQGQGYNTYLQELGLADAVSVKPGPPLPDTYRLTYNSEKITNYLKLAQSLEITAGAAISGWDQSAKIDASYLDRSEFESSTTTYQVEVSSQQQGTIGNSYSFNKVKTDNPNKIYGDRFITDFIKGGKFLARVSITSTSKSHNEEIKQAAEVAFSMYGTTGKVTEGVKKAVETINKQGQTKVYIHILGGGNKPDQTLQSNTESQDAESPLFEIKSQADAFYNELRAGKHKYRRLYVRLFNLTRYSNGQAWTDEDSAVLWKYTNVPNFQNEFEPFDYTFASKKSWKLFEDFTQYGVFIDNIKKTPVDKFIDGRQQQSNLYNKGTKLEEEISNKVKAINGDPSEVQKSFSYLSPWEFQKSVLLAIKTVTMIAQQRAVQGGSVTDIALPTLEGGATELFKFKVFDFNGVPGTSVVSFGNKDSHYLCLKDLRVSQFGYQEESVFWAFPTQEDGFADQKIIVSKLRTADLIRLSLEGPGPKFLFDFYAHKSA